MYSNSVSFIISPEVIFDSRMSNINLDTVVQACSANYDLRSGDKAFWRHHFPDV
jgi:hypothetical protein